MKLCAYEKELGISVKQRLRVPLLALSWRAHDCVARLTDEQDSAAASYLGAFGGVAASAVVCVRVLLVWGKDAENGAFVLHMGTWTTVLIAYKILYATLGMHWWLLSVCSRQRISRSLISDRNLVEPTRPKEY